MAITHSSRFRQALTSSQDAIVQYRRALTLQPANPSVECNPALAFYKNGQTDTAAGIVHRAAPDELQPVLLLADCRLGAGN